MKIGLGCYPDADIQLKKCIIDTCNNIIKAKGLCSKHYEKLRKYGDSLASKPFVYKIYNNPDKLCECGCGEKLPKTQHISRKLRRFISGHNMKLKNKPTVMTTCAECGVTFCIYQSVLYSKNKRGNKNFYCSEHCFHISRRNKDKYFLRSMRDSGEYIKWREEVFHRDLYRCTDCGSSGWIEAHHLLQFSEHHDLVFNPDNGITLCESCHKKRHNTGFIHQGLIKPKEYDRLFNLIFYEEQLYV